MIAARAEPWFSIATPRPAARVRLFCFAHAGGGASSYFAWSRALGPAIEVWAVQPPGRENRLREPPFTTIEDLVQDLAGALAPIAADRPYALFGHSMGAMVAFELTRVLREQEVRLPVQLFVSGAHAPDVPLDEEPLHPIADDAEFLSAVASRYGGVPKMVLDNVELRALIVPALRADLRSLESYELREATPLPVDIAAYGGTLDRMVKPDGLARWAHHTSGTFSCTMLDGDHFFLQDARDALLADVSSHLNRRLAL